MGNARGHGGKPSIRAVGHPREKGGEGRSGIHAHYSGKTSNLEAVDMMFMFVHVGCPFQSAIHR